jgi:hypothetical protein
MSGGRCVVKREKEDGSGFGVLILLEIWEDYVMYSQIPDWHGVFSLIF